MEKSAGGCEEISWYLLTTVSPWTSPASQTPPPALGTGVGGGIQATGEWQGDQPALLLAQGGQG